MSLTNATVARPLHTVTIMLARKHLIPLLSAGLIITCLAAPSTARAACASATVEVYQYPKSTIEMKKFFNMATCKCKTKVEVYLKFTTLPGTSCSNDKFMVLAGQSCFNTSTNEPDTTKCAVLQAELAFNSVTKVEFPVGTLPANQIMGNSGCSELDAQTNGIFAYSKNSSGTWETTAFAKIDIPLDTKGPTAPVKDAAPSPGENQVTISFKSAYTASAGDGGSGATKEKDLKGYQVLCAKLDKEGGSIVEAGLASAPAAIYQTAANVCVDAKLDGGVADSSVADASTADSSSTTSWPPGPQPRAAEAGVKDSGAKDSSPDSAATADAGVDASGDGTTTFPDSGSSSSASDSLPASYVCSAKINTDGTEPIKGLENGTAYRFWIVAVDDLGNASSLTLLGDATPQQEEDLWERYKRSKGKAKGEYCFVATAAYGSYDHPHVVVLRDFRDQVLLKSGAGHAVVDTYYAVSPGPARWLAGSDGTRAVARVALWPVTLAAGTVVYTSPWQKGVGLMALGMMVMLVGLRARRRAARKGGQS